MAIAKYMVDYPTLVTKDLFEIVKVQQLKTYYNTFIKPGKLVKYWLFINYIKHNCNQNSYIKTNNNIY